MSAVSVQVTYRRGRPVAAYIHLGRGVERKTARTEKVTPDLLVDFGHDGAPLGIEVLDPEAVALQQILEVFDSLGLGRPSPADLAPLRAA